MVHLDVGKAALGGEGVELVAPESGFDQVRRQERVEVGAPNASLFGVVHPQGPVRQAVGDPDLVLSDRRAPATVSDRRDADRLEARLYGLLGQAHRQPVEWRQLFSPRDGQLGQTGL